jgi:hypothetical protein
MYDSFLYERFLGNFIMFDLIDVTLDNLWPKIFVYTSPL